MTYPNQRLLVTVDWLSDRLDDEAVAVLDMRGGTDPLAYRRAHLPGALPFSLSHAQALVAGTPGCLDEEAMARQLAALGVRPEQTVVLYDAGLSTTLSHAFWALEWMGQRAVRVLDGGLAAWRDAGRALESRLPSAAPCRYEAARRDCRVDGEWLEAHAGACQLVDARTPQEWRAGTIEGAANLTWSCLLDGEPPAASLRPAEEVDALLAARRLTPTRDTVAFCRSGRRASFVYFVLRLMGWERAFLYDGSMLDWLLHERPVT